ncbi:MAG TPA: hypothetical protein VF787_01245 [Thermoanaerobaculia bacterium]
MRTRMVAFLLCLTLLAPAAFACSCIQLTAKENFEAADAVLVGKVIRLEVTKEHQGVSTIEATVRVIEARKGKFTAGQEVTFVTDDGCCYCSYSYVIAGTYLLYANAEEQRWSTSSCMRSGLVHEPDVKADLKELGFARLR